MHRENRENGKKKIPVKENTGNLEILPKHRENTGNLVCSNYKSPDSKGKRYFDICHKNPVFTFVWIALSLITRWHHCELVTEGAAVTFLIVYLPSCLKCLDVRVWPQRVESAYP